MHTCNQVRYSSVINTGNVTKDCVSSLSARCSMTDLQLYIHLHDNSEVQNGSDIRSRRQAPQNSLVVDDEGYDTRHNYTLTSLCFFSFGPWITARLVPIRRRSTVLLRSISPMPGSQVYFFSRFDVPSPKRFDQPGDRQSCHASNIGSALEKRKEINFFKKYSWS